MVNSITITFIVFWTIACCVLLSPPAKAFVPSPAAAVVVNPPSVLTDDFILKAIKAYLDSPDDGGTWEYKQVRLVGLTDWKLFKWQGVSSWCSRCHFAVEHEGETLLCDTILVYNEDKGIQFVAPADFRAAISQ